MRLVIMQPSYLPWLGYFDLLEKADLFLVYDNAQFDKESWRNRNRIKTANGAQWLTVPVLTKGQNKPSNREIRINNNEFWGKKHLKTLEINYRKAPHFGSIYPSLEGILSRQWEFLIDLNMACLHKMCELFALKPKIGFTSDLKLELPEDRNDKLVAICRHCQADEFYEPEGGRGYIEPEKFSSQGIRLTFQEFQHPVYPQLYGPFLSHLSAVDFLFNCGAKAVQ